MLRKVFVQQQKKNRIRRVDFSLKLQTPVLHFKREFAKALPEIVPRPIVVPPLSVLDKLNRQSASQGSSFYVLPAETRCPEKLERYRLGKELGRGKFAIVREAVDTHVLELRSTILPSTEPSSPRAAALAKQEEEEQRQDEEEEDTSPAVVVAAAAAASNSSPVNVAVKIMNKKLCGRQMCKQELSILQEIKREVGHPRLTPIIDVFEDEENLYVVLELMQGGELFKVVQEKGRVTEEEAAVFIRKLVNALDSLHRVGILHRDIKLENIALTNDASSGPEKQTSEFKILDFGFAKKDGEKDQFSGPAGTLGYMAPESLRFREYGPASDIWSAGVVLYILLAGYSPFPLSDEALERQLSMNGKISAELEAIEHGRAEAMWRLQFLEEPWPSISMEAKKLVSRMLTIDPKKRVTSKQILNSTFIKRYTAHSQREFMNFE